MAKCVRCGKRGFFLQLYEDQYCSSCIEAVRQERIIEENRKYEEKIRQEIQKREEEERKAAEARQRRQEEKLLQHKELIASICQIDLAVSPELAPIMLTKDQPVISYSTITKKTPRDTLGNFVVVDTETTGLHPSSCEVIDIAAIRFRNYIPIEKVSMLLSAKKAIPEEITKLTGITNEMVAGQPRFQQIAASLVEFIGNDNIVGHNLPFDLSFILRYGADVTKAKRKYYDTLAIAQKTLKKANYKWNDRLCEYTCGDYDVVDHKLSTLCKRYQIPNLDSHRAESDALATGLLLKHLADARL